MTQTFITLKLHLGFPQELDEKTIAAIRDKFVDVINQNRNSIIDLGNTQPQDANKIQNCIITTYRIAPPITAESQSLVSAFLGQEEVVEKTLN